MEKLVWLALMRCFSVLVLLSLPVSMSAISTDGRSIARAGSRAPHDKKLGREKRKDIMLDMFFFSSSFETLIILHSLRLMIVAT